MDVLDFIHKFIAYIYVEFGMTRAAADIAAGITMLVLLIVEIFGVVVIIKDTLAETNSNGKSKSYAAAFADGEFDVDLPMPQQPSTSLTKAMEISKETQDIVEAFLRKLPRILNGAEVLRTLPREERKRLEMVLGQEGQQLVLQLVSQAAEAIRVLDELQRRTALQLEQQRLNGAVGIAALDSGLKAIAVQKKIWEQCKPRDTHSLDYAAAELIYGACLSHVISSTIRQTGAINPELTQRFLAHAAQLELPSGTIEIVREQLVQEPHVPAVVERRGGR